ncbi:thioredoxin family protein [Patescibacteria group bacterium]
MSKSVTNGKVHMVDDSNFEEEVLGHKGLVLLDVYADWCGPCRILGPRMEELAKAQKNGKVKIAKLDAKGGGDKRPITTTKLKVMALPTIIVFKDGEEVERFRGVQETWRLEKAIADHL